MRKHCKMISGLLAVGLLLTAAGCTKKAEDSSSLTSQPPTTQSQAAQSQATQSHVVQTPVPQPQAPQLVTPKYPAEDVIIADVVATDKEYGADPTGEKDSTVAIRTAIQACSEGGGGTVWLPAGKYRITESITLPSFVTLRGDWQDPDVGNEYGTVIWVDIDPTKAAGENGLFYLSGSGGVMGLTVYYPHQSLSAVKEYPFTFYVAGLRDGYMLQSIVNCTVINGYKGIGACVTGTNAHEQLTVENFKGTFLNCGAEAYNQADVGTWKNVSLGNQYWANANTALGMKKPNRSELDSYTRQHATGLLLGDLEWTQLIGIKLSGFQNGIHIVRGKRASFCGELFDVKITDCDYGILANDMDARWGTNIAKGQISGSKYSICNRSSGLIKMTDVTLDGKTTGLILPGDDSLSDISIDLNRTAPKPQQKLYLFSETDAADDISGPLQSLLDRAGKEGGGVVYLPAGQYYLKAPITVPAGVELRGSSSVATREQASVSKGTLILPFYGNDTKNPDSDTALVTLNGKNAGIRGIRFFYTDNLYLNGVSKAPYTIRGKAAGVYAINVAITAGYNGVDFRNCDNHLIKMLQGCAYSNMMTVGGKNGLVEGCLQNGTAITRQGINGVSVSESNIFAELIDPITRQQTEYIRISGADGQTVFNSFIYGGKTVLVNKNSTNVTVVNLGGDNIGDTAPFIDMQSGSLTGINLMRYNGISYQRDGGSLTLYNRLAINDRYEVTVRE